MVHSPVPEVGRSGKPALIAVVPMTLPIAVGYIPLGVAFGVLFQRAGGDWWMAPLMSLIVHAGGSQFLAVSLMALGLSVWEIALSAALVNLRHAFYGLSFPLHKIKGLASRIYAIQALTDETYSLASSGKIGDDGQRMLAVQIITHAYWVGGSALGAIIGSRVPSSFDGLDFCLICLFAVLATEQFTSTRRIAPILIAAAANALVLFLAPAQSLTLAIAASSGSVVLWIVLRRR